MNRLVSAKPVSCAVNPACGRETTYGLKPLAQKKKVLIAGAGLSGMEAARVLKLRGHDVEICEKSDRAGGSLNIAGAPSFKEDDIALIRWYERTLAELGVPVHLNTPITKETLAGHPHDVLLAATGSNPRTLKLPGSNTMYKAEDILSGEVEPGQRVAIIGGGLVGCELALDLAQKGRQVTILEALPEILAAGSPMPHMNRIMLLDLLRHHNVELVGGAKVDAVEGTTIQYHRDGQAAELPVDTVVYAIGYQADNRLYQELLADEAELFVIGDARRVRNIMYAIWDAYELANNI